MYNTSQWLFGLSYPFTSHLSETSAAVFKSGGVEHPAGADLTGVVEEERARECLRVFFFRDLAHSALPLARPPRSEVDKHRL